MDAVAGWVRVYWRANVPGSHPLPPPGACRLLVRGPGVPATSAVLVRTPVGAPRGGVGSGLGPGAGRDVGFEVAYGVALADEHLVAEAGSGGRWAAVADVLIVRTPPGPPATLAARSPGRLVTAYDGREPVLDVAGEGAARLLPLPGRMSAGVWPYASFAHAWTVAGRPLGALHGAHLTNGCFGVRVSVVECPEAWPAAS